MTKIKSHLLPGDDAYAGEFYETAPKIEADKELDEIIPHISGGCFCAGGCIYWQSIKDGEVDNVKLHELAKTALLAWRDKAVVAERKRLHKEISNAIEMTRKKYLEPWGKTEPAEEPLLTN